MGLLTPIPATLEVNVKWNMQGNKIYSFGSVQIFLETINIDRQKKSTSFRRYKRKTAGIDKAYQVYAHNVNRTNLKYKQRDYILQKMFYNFSLFL